MPFTGIVQDLGKIVYVSPSGSKSTKELVLKISPLGNKHGIGSGIMDDKRLYNGESICVDGICLTVTDFSINENWFQVGLCPHTVEITTAGDYAIGTEVNLECAFVPGTGISGHNVQGHVDGVAKIINKQIENDVCVLDFSWPTGVAHKGLIPLRGYVSVNGTSLTVSNCHPGINFSVTLIKHTQQCVNLPNKNVGEYVNIETDITGKYALGGGGSYGNINGGVLGGLTLGIVCAGLGYFAAKILQRPK